MLFKVRLINGRDQWVLCHLEIQTSYEAEFAFRIDSYNAGLKWMFRQEVVTLVILADLKPDWRPTEHRFELGEFDILTYPPRTQFPRSPETQESRNPGTLSPRNPVPQEPSPLGTQSPGALRPRWPWP